MRKNRKVADGVRGGKRGNEAEKFPHACDILFCWFDSKAYLAGDKFAKSPTEKVHLWQTVEVLLIRHKIEFIR